MAHFTSLDQYKLRLSPIFKGGYMKDFYNIAQFIANQTRQSISDKKQPDDNGVITVYFEVFDKAFVKSYFGENCQNSCFAFSLHAANKINALQHKLCSELVSEQLLATTPDEKIHDPRVAAVIVTSKEKSERPLLRIIVATHSAHDGPCNAQQLLARTTDSLAHLDDCLYEICGEYCKTRYIYWS